VLRNQAEAVQRGPAPVGYMQPEQAVRWTAPSAPNPSAMCP